DGPLLAWLKYAAGIDALVALPSDRLLYEDLQGLARGGLIRWTRHRYVRTVAGHKQRRGVEAACRGGLTSWEGVTAAAAADGAAAGLAFKTAGACRLAAGRRLAKKGSRRLRREYRRELGAAPVVVYVAGCYAVLSVEELLAALGRPVQESLLPFGGRPEVADP